MFRKIITKTLKTKRPVELIWLKSSDTINVPKVLHHLNTEYYNNDPLFQAIKANSPIDLSIQNLSSMYVIDANASIAAIDPEDGSVVGVALNDIFRRVDIDLREERIRMLKNETKKNYLHLKYWDLMSKIGEDVDLFNKYPHVDAMLELAIGSINKNWRKDGLGELMINHSLFSAVKYYQCGLGFAICNSMSTQLVNACGFQPMWSMNLADFKDGDKVIFPLKPKFDIITCCVNDIGDYWEKQEQM